MAMAPTTTPQQLTQPGRRVQAVITEPRWVRLLLTAVAISFLAMFLFIPLVAVFVNAFSLGYAYRFGRRLSVGAAGRYLNATTSLDGSTFTDLQTCGAEPVAIG